MNKLLFSLFLLSGIIACQQRNPDGGGPEKVVAADVDSSFSHFVDQADIRHARHFEVTYHPNYKVVRTFSDLKSWSGGDRQHKSDILVLVQRGTPAPDLSGDLANAQLIQIPVEKVALNVVSSESYLDALDLLSCIVAVGGHGSYIDTLRNGVISGKIGKVGYSWHQPPEMEVLLSLAPDAFFMQLANLDYQEHLRKCRDLGIPSAPVFEWAEESYLGRAEWIKYFALFFNEEKKANDFFQKVENNVDSIRTLVKQAKGKPTAIWGYFAGNDKWWFNTHNLEAQFLEDAGLENAISTNKVGDPDTQEQVSSERLLQLGKDAEHWIIGDIHSVALPSEDYMSTFKAWRTNQLLHNMKRSKLDKNAYDWYGSAQVRPDLILADIVHLTQPEILPAHQSVYLDRFDKRMPLPIPREKL